MVATAPVELLEPDKIRPNPDNPRLIFRSDELEALEKSISQQGILVPLTIFQDGKFYTLLDGERRWRCARKLGLHRVPAIIQEKPDRITNIMMMFAIHNARNDWDPLPTALKLEELEKELSKQLDRSPTEAELAAAASLSRGEVRRYRKILRLPDDLKSQLLEELNKPRVEQHLTVDHVIETISGVNQLVNRGIIRERSKERLINSTIEKFKASKLRSTTEPRLFARIARSYERGEIKKEVILEEIQKFHSRKDYTIENIFENTSMVFDFEYSTEQLLYRTIHRLEEILETNAIRSDSLAESIGQMEKILRRVKRLL